MCADVYSSSSLKHDDDVYCRALKRGYGRVRWRRVVVSCVRASACGQTQSKDDVDKARAHSNDSMRRKRPLRLRLLIPPFLAGPLRTGGLSIGFRVSWSYTPDIDSTHPQARDGVGLVLLWNALKQESACSSLLASLFFCIEVPLNARLADGRWMVRRNPSA